MDEHHPHVLLADDDENVRRIFGHYLAKADYDVIYARDGNECREMARRLQPDIILLDYNMPVLDGMETTKLLKSEVETRHIPIILFTNDDLSIEAEKAFRELGIDDYAHKSVEPSILINKIKSVLNLETKTRPRLIWVTSPSGKPSTPKMVSL